MKPKVSCVDCGRVARGYRLVSARNYDRQSDPEPEFRCEECSERKLQDLQGKGVILH